MQFVNISSMKLNRDKIHPLASDNMVALESIAADLSHTTTQLIDCIKDISNLSADQQKHTANVLSKLVETQRGNREQDK